MSRSEQLMSNNKPAPHLSQAQEQEGVRPGPPGGETTEGAEKTLASLVRHVLDADPSTIAGVLDEVASHAAALVHTRQNSAGAVIAGLSVAAAAHGIPQNHTESLVSEALRQQGVR